MHDTELISITTFIYFSPKTTPQVSEVALINIM